MLTLQGTIRWGHIGGFGLLDLRVLKLVPDLELERESKALSL